MNQAEKLEKYVLKNLLDFEVFEDILTSDEKEYQIVDSDRILFNSDFVFSDKKTPLDGWVYEFAGRWFTQDKEEEEVQMLELKSVEKAVQKIPTKSFLGIHSKYEILNGVGSYQDWIKKARFLETKVLGICEKNTLAGVLEFQNLCKQNDIKPIIGLTIPVALSQNTCDIKLYAKDFQGWLNLLKFNSEIQIEKKSDVTSEFLKANSEGLFIVIDPKTTPFHEVEGITDIVDFYQLESVVYTNSSVDKLFLENLGEYLKSAIKPISITDAYYVDQDDSICRDSLWKVSKIFDLKSDNQFFKSKDQYATELSKMFSQKSWTKIVKKAFANESYLVENCNFQYDTDTRHLPKYKMRPEEEEQFSSNYDFFMHLVKTGFKNRSLEKTQEYIYRLEKEIKVFQDGDVLDYFLSTYDIIREAKEMGYLVGFGRGSAGGSFVAYLLGIINMNPFDFDLLFERFLNSGRMGEWQDRPMYEVEQEDGATIGMPEGSLIRILKNGKETAVFIQDLKEGDEIIRY